MRQKIGRRLSALIVAAAMSVLMLPATALADYDNGVTTKVVGTTYVASVTTSESATYYYTSFTTAISDAQSGDTITLLADVALTSKQTISGKDITLDLDSYSITRALSYSFDYLLEVSSDASLTVKSSSGTGSISSGGSVIYNYGGTLTIESGTIKGNTYGLYLRGGTTYITGGAISGLASGVLHSGGTLTISGGTITGGSYYSVRVESYYSDTTTTITGGTITGGSSGFYIVKLNNNSYKSTVNISGGTITSTFVKNSNANASVTISGGTFKTNVAAYLADNNVLLYDEETKTYTAMTKDDAKDQAAVAVTYGTGEEAYTIYYTSADAIPEGDSGTISQCKVTFEDYDGEEISSEWVAASGTVSPNKIPTEDPTRVDYSFTGWYDGTNTYTTTADLAAALADLTITTDMTFTAQYEANATDTEEEEGTTEEDETTEEEEETVASTGDDTNILVFGGIAILAVAGALVARKKLYVK